MAKIDREGYLYIVGRKKEMVNVRGLNVYPREIEEENSSSKSGTDSGQREVSD
jgi:acyl-CoA synthetase (AMP-forming)/AMP-acid ligase II